MLWLLVWGSTWLLACIYSTWGDLGGFFSWFFLCFFSLYSVQSLTLGINLLGPTFWGVLFSELTQFTKSLCPNSSASEDPYCKGKVVLLMKSWNSFPKRWANLQKSKKLKKRLQCPDIHCEMILRSGKWRFYLMRENFVNFRVISPYYLRPQVI